MKTNKLYTGDSTKVLKRLADASIDSVVTDPPYFVGFMGKSWDKSKGRQDTINTYLPIFKEIYRVLRPGGHLLAFSLPKTAHYTACLIEDSGFEIRDSIHWLFGSGFPKSFSPWNNAWRDEIEKQLKEQGVDGEIKWK